MAPLLGLSALPDRHLLHGQRMLSRWHAVIGVRSHDIAEHDPESGYFDECEHLDFDFDFDIGFDFDLPVLLYFHRVKHK